MADPMQLIAYPPIKRFIKQEVPDEPQETNSVEEENWALQNSVVKADPPLVAYLPLKCSIKLEIPDSDEGQEVNNGEEENWRLQLPKESITSTGYTTSASGLIVNASLPSKDYSGKTQGHLRAPSRDRQPNVTALEGETHQQDTEIMDEVDTEEEGSEYDKGSEKSEHSSLVDFDDSFAVDSTDDEHLMPSPKAGPSKEPTRQVQNCKKKEEGSNHTALQNAPFKCSKCERCYKRKASLTVHLKFQCGLEPQFQCTKCDRQFKLKKSLRKHLINIHQVDEKQLEKHGAGLKKLQVLPFKCSNCESSFKRKRSLVQHMNHECGVAFTCSECQQNCKTKCSLRGHLLGVHKIARHQLDQFGAGYKIRPEQPYKCDQCDRTYRLKGSLTRHKKAECGAEPSLLCPQCDYRTKVKSNLKLHLMEAHNVERSQLVTLGLGLVIRQDTQFKCDLCGRSYQHKKQLKLHLRECGK